MSELDSGAAPTVPKCGTGMLRYMAEREMGDRLFQESFQSARGTQVDLAAVIDGAVSLAASRADAYATELFRAGSLPVGLQRQMATERWIGIFRSALLAREPTEKLSRRQLTATRTAASMRTVRLFRTLARGARDPNMPDPDDLLLAEARARRLDEIKRMEAEIRREHLQRKRDVRREFGREARAVYEPSPSPFIIVTTFAAYLLSVYHLALPATIIGAIVAYMFVATVCKDSLSNRRKRQSNRIRWTNRIIKTFLSTSGRRSWSWFDPDTYRRSARSTVYAVPGLVLTVLSVFVALVISVFRATRSSLEAAHELVLVSHRSSCFTKSRLADQTNPPAFVPWPPNTSLHSSI